MAVGKTLGVARNKEFIAVKFGSDVQFAIPANLVDCWHWIIDDVKAGGRIRKAIINLSYGKPSPLGFCSLALLFTFFKFSSKLGGLMKTVTGITLA